MMSNDYIEINNSDYILTSNTHIKKESYKEYNDDWINPPHTTNIHSSMSSFIATYGEEYDNSKDIIRNIYKILYGGLTLAGKLFLLVEDRDDYKYLIFKSDIVPHKQDLIFDKDFRETDLVESHQGKYIFLEHSIPTGITKFDAYTAYKFDTLTRWSILDLKFLT